MSTLMESTASRIGADTKRIRPLIVDIRLPQGTTRTVHVTGTKCSIGSAANCNLRLIGPGIQPLHCSILRGPSGVCLQRWAGQVWLNGLEVSESFLKSGDMIQLGELRLEVYSDGVSAESPEETPTSDRPPARLSPDLRRQFRKRLRRLITELRSWKDRDSQSQAILQERAEVVARLEQRIGELQSACDQHLDVSRRAEQVCSELELRNLDFAKTIDQLRSEVAVSEQRNEQSVAAQLLQLEQSRSELSDSNQNAARLLALCEQLKIELQARESEHERLRERETRLRQELAATCQSERTLQADRESLREQLRQQEESLQAAAADAGMLPAVRQDLDSAREELTALRQQREEFEQQLAAKQRELDELRTTIASTSSAPESLSDRETLEASAQQAAARIQDLEQQLHRTTADLSAAETRERDADGRCQSLRQSLSVVEQTATKLRSQGEAHRTALDRQRAELEFAHQESEKLRQRITDLELQLEDSRSAANESLNAQEAIDSTDCNVPSDSQDPTDAEEAIGSQEAMIDSSESPAVAEAVTEKPVSVSAADVIAKLRAKGILRDESAAESAEVEPASASPPDHSRSRSVAEVELGPTVAQTVGGAQTEGGAQAAGGLQAVGMPPTKSVVPTAVGSTPAGTHREEESIEDYMSRLMARVRGEKSGSVAPVAAKPLPTPQLKAQDTNSDPERSETDPKVDQTNVNYSQRTVPAEYKSNLAVMREIAKNSARSAIAVHQRHHGSRAATGKWLGSGIALLCSVGISYLAGGARWQIAGAACGFGIAIYWAIQGVQITLAARDQKVEPEAAAESPPHSTTPAPLENRTEAVSFDLDLGLELSTRQTGSEH